MPHLLEIPKWDGFVQFRAIPAWLAAAARSAREIAVLRVLRLVAGDEVGGIGLSAS
jgi:hypothetical protein